MKRILLTSTVLVAFAGAAAAEITWSGDAEMGYNDKAKDGFFFGAGLGIKGKAELNNGLEAGFTFDVDVTFTDDAPGTNAGTFDAINFDASDYSVYLKNDMATLTFGDTKTAAERVFIGGLKTPIEGNTFFGQETFLEDSNIDDADDTVDGILRVDAELAGFDVAVSGVVYNDAGDHKLGALQVAASGSFNQFNFGFAYQQEDDDVTLVPASEGLFGVYGSTTFAGLDLTLGYVADQTNEENTFGATVAYAFGDVKVAGLFAVESEGDNTFGVEAQYDAAPVLVNAYFYREGDNNEIAVEAAYDVMADLTVKAGYIKADPADGEFYAGAEYDLGSGAALTASYSQGDEIGNPEYKEGTTLMVSFDF